MKDVVVYTVIPKLPERLKPLEEMARNLWFCWNLEVIDLFRSIDPDLWEETGHNPLAMVSSLGNDRIKELLEDDGFLLEMDRITAEFRRYMGERKTYCFGLEAPIDFTIAYFSAEYGLTDCLPIYSGGWAFSPETTSSLPATCASRWWASACSTRRDISDST